MRALGTHVVLAAALAGAGALGALAACAATPARASTLTSDDLVVTTDQMASQLAASEFLGSRTPESPPIVIAIDKVQNLTSDLIPEGQQWWMMARVRDQLNLNTLRRDRNVRFVIPRQYLREGMERGNLEDGVAARAPTHQMSATFHSATRFAKATRTDAYLCEYRITSLETGELQWSGTFEFKRAAFGKAYD